MRPPEAHLRALLPLLSYRWRPLLEALCDMVPTACFPWTLVTRQLYMLHIKIRAVFSHSYHIPWLYHLRHQEPARSFFCRRPSQITENSSSSALTLILKMPMCFNVINIVRHNLKVTQISHLVTCHFFRKKHRVKAENCVQLDGATWRYRDCIVAHPSNTAPLPRLAVCSVTHSHPLPMLQLSFRFQNAFLLPLHNSYNPLSHANWEPFSREGFMFFSYYVLPSLLGFLSVFLHVPLMKCLTVVPLPNFSQNPVFFIAHVGLVIFRNTYVII